MGLGTIAESLNPMLGTVLFPPGGGIENPKPWIPWNIYSKQARIARLLRLKRGSMSKGTWKRYSRSRRRSRFRRRRRFVKRVRMKRRKGFKRKRTSSRKSTFAKKVCRIARRCMDEGQGHQIYRHRHNANLESKFNQYEHNEWAFDKTVVENCLQKLEFYNPATGGLTVRDWNADTIAKDVWLRSYTVQTIKNNSNHACKIEYMIYTPKTDTDKKIMDLFKDSELADQGTNLFTASNMMNVGDSKALKTTWRVYKRFTKTLNPGATFTVKHDTGKFKYCNSVHDVLTDAYSPRIRSHIHFIRLRGVMGTTIGTPTVGAHCSSAAIEMIRYRKTDVYYDAGIPLKRIYVDDDVLDPTSTSYVVTKQRPVLASTVNEPPAVNGAYGTGSTVVRTGNSSATTEKDS